MEQSRWSFKQCSHWEETSQGNILSWPLEINTLWEVEWISGDLAQESYELVILGIALKRTALLYEHLYSLFIIRNTVWKQRFQTSLLALHAWREDILTLFFLVNPQKQCACGWMTVLSPSLVYCFLSGLDSLIIFWENSQKGTQEIILPIPLPLVWPQLIPSTTQNKGGIISCSKLFTAETHVFQVLPPLPSLTASLS